MPKTIKKAAKAKRKPLIDKALLNVLACPVCKSSVKVIDLRGKKKKIEGQIVCQNKKCGITYPIEDGIPIMLPPELR